MEQKKARKAIVVRIRHRGQEPWSFRYAILEPTLEENGSKKLGVPNFRKKDEEQIVGLLGVLKKMYTAVEKVT